MLKYIGYLFFCYCLSIFNINIGYTSNSINILLQKDILVEQQKCLSSSGASNRNNWSKNIENYSHFNDSSSKRKWLELTIDEWNCTSDHKYYIHKYFDLKTYLGITCGLTFFLNPMCHSVFHNCLVDFKNNKEDCYQKMYTYALAGLNSSDLKTDTNRIDDFNKNYCNSNAANHIKYNYIKLLDLLNAKISYTASFDSIKSYITNIDNIIKETNALTEKLKTYLSFVSTNDNNFDNGCSVEVDYYTKNLAKIESALQIKKTTLKNITQKDLTDATTTQNTQINNLLLFLIQDGIIYNKSLLDGFLDVKTNKYKVGIPAKEKFYLLERQQYYLSKLKEEKTIFDIKDFCKTDENSTNQFCQELTKNNPDIYCDTQQKIMNVFCNQERLFRANLEEACQNQYNILNPLCQKKFQTELNNICPFSNYSQNVSSCVNNSDAAIINKCNSLGNANSLCKIIKAIASVPNYCKQNQEITTLFCSEQLYRFSDTTSEDYKKAINSIQSSYCSYVTSSLCNEKLIENPADKEYCNIKKAETQTICQVAKGEEKFKIEGYDFCNKSENAINPFCEKIKASKSTDDSCMDNENKNPCPNKKSTLKEFCADKDNYDNPICVNSKSTYCGNIIKTNSEENKFCKEDNIKTFKQKYTKLLDLHNKKLIDSDFASFRTNKVNLLQEINTLITELINDYPNFLKASFNKDAPISETDFFDDKTYTYQAMIEPELKAIKNLNDKLITELNNIQPAAIENKITYNENMKNILDILIIDGVNINEKVITNILLNYNIFDIDTYTATLNNKNIFDKDAIKLVGQANLIVDNISSCYENNFDYRELYAKSMLKSKLDLIKILISNLINFSSGGFPSEILGDKNLHLQAIMEIKSKIYKAIIYMADSSLKEKGLLKSQCQNISNDKLNIDTSLDKIIKSNIYQYTQNKKILDEFFKKDGAYNKQLKKEALSLTSLLTFVKGIEGDSEEGDKTIEKKIIEYSTVSPYLYDLSYIIYLEGGKTSDAPIINKFLIDELSKYFIFPDPFSNKASNTKNVTRYNNIAAIELRALDATNAVQCLKILKEPFFCTIKNTIFGRYADPQDKFNNLELLVMNDNLKNFANQYNLHCKPNLDAIRIVTEEDVEAYANEELETITATIDDKSIYTDCSKYNPVIGEAIKYSNESTINQKGTKTFKKMKLSNISSITNFKEFIVREENYFNNYGIMSFLDLSIVLQRINQYETKCQDNEKLDKARYQTLLNELTVIQTYVDKALKYHHKDSYLYKILNTIEIKEKNLLNKCQKLYSKSIGGSNIKHNGFVKSGCFLLSLINGPLGKTLATLYIIFVGFSLLNGKFEFGQMVSIVLAFGFTFGANGIAKLMSGNENTCEIILNLVEDDTSDNEFIPNPIQCEPGYVYSMKSSACIKSACKNPSLPNVTFINPINSVQGSDNIVLEENGEPIVGSCNSGYRPKNKNVGEANTDVKASCVSGIKWRYDGECEAILCSIDKENTETESEVNDYLNSIDKKAAKHEINLRKRFYAENWTVLSTNFGSIIQANCAKGYYNLGLNKKTFVLAECKFIDNQPTWETIGTCSGAICEEINLAKTMKENGLHGNATWPQTNFKENNVITGECLKSHKADLINKPTRSCLPDGIWGEITNPCAATTCPIYKIDDYKIFDLRHPDYDPVTNVVKDTVITATKNCPVGYMTNDANDFPTAICTEDGTWRDILKCRKLCEPLKADVYNIAAESIKSKYVTGTVLSINCKLGYNTTGLPGGSKNITLTCQEDTTWSNNETCKATVCTGNNLFEDTALTKSITKVDIGSKAYQKSCDSGYAGYKTVICNEGILTVDTTAGDTCVKIPGKCWSASGGRTVSAVQTADLSGADKNGNNRDATIDNSYNGFIDTDCCNPNASEPKYVDLDLKLQKALLDNNDYSYKTTWSTKPKQEKLIKYASLSENNMDLKCVNLAGLAMQTTVPNDAHSDIKALTDKKVSGDTSTGKYIHKFNTAISRKYVYFSYRPAPASAKSTLNDGSNLTGANFSGASFGNDTFFGFNKYSSGNPGSNLTNANFSGASFNGAYFGSNYYSSGNPGSNLTGADFSGASFNWDAIFGSNTSGSSGNPGSNLTNTDFSGAIFNGPVFFGFNYSSSSGNPGSNLTKANFSGTSFNGYAYFGLNERNSSGNPGSNVKGAKFGGIYEIDGKIIESNFKDIFRPELAQNTNICAIQYFEGSNNATSEFLSRFQGMECVGTPTTPWPDNVYNPYCNANVVNCCAKPTTAIQSSATPSTCSSNEKWDGIREVDYRELPPKCWSASGGKKGDWYTGTTPTDTQKNQPSASFQATINDSYKGFVDTDCCNADEGLYVSLDLKLKKALGNPADYDTTWLNKPKQEKLIKYASLSGNNMDLKCVNLAGLDLSQKDSSNNSYISTFNTAISGKYVYFSFRPAPASAKSTLNDGANLAGANFSGANFSNEIYFGYNNYSSSGNPGSNLAGANFSGASFDNDVSFGDNYSSSGNPGSNLAGANFSGASFDNDVSFGFNSYSSGNPGSNLTNANFSGANFNRYVIFGYNSSSSGNPGSNLSNADFSGASFSSYAYFGYNYSSSGNPGSNVKGAKFGGKCVESGSTKCKSTTSNFISTGKYKGDKFLNTILNTNFALAQFYSESTGALITKPSDVEPLSKYSLLQTVGSNVYNPYCNANRANCCAKPTLKNQSSSTPSTCSSGQEKWDGTK